MNTAPQLVCSFRHPSYRHLRSDGSRRSGRRSGLRSGFRSSRRSGFTQEVRNELIQQRRISSSAHSAAYILQKRKKIEMSLSGELYTTRHLSLSGGKWVYPAMKWAYPPGFWAYLAKKVILSGANWVYPAGIWAYLRKVIWQTGWQPSGLWNLIWFINESAS